MIDFLNPYFATLSTAVRDRETPNLLVSLKELQDTSELLEG
jgi:hypothetical protein